MCGAASLGGAAPKTHHDRVIELGGRLRVGFPSSRGGIDDGMRDWFGEERGQEMSTGDDSFCVVVVGCRAVVVVAHAVRVDPGQHDLLTRGTGHAPACRSTQSAVVGRLWSVGCGRSVVVGRSSSVGCRRRLSSSRSFAVRRRRSLDVRMLCLHNGRYSSAAVIETAWPIGHCR